MTGEAWEDYFLPGERLVWSSAPVPGFHPGWGHLFMSFFGFPFLIGGLVMVGGGFYFASRGAGWEEIGISLFVAVFGVPFLGVGLHLVFGTWIATFLAPRRIRYAVSSRAAYVANSIWSQKLSIYPITRATTFELDKGRSADTVWFHVRTEEDSEGTTTTRIGFEKIAEGENVLRRLRQVQADLTAQERQDGANA